MAGGVAHAHRPEEIRRGLEAGVDCFEHTGLAAAPEYPPDVIAALEPTFGGVNLEDLKAPECFYIERKLRERMKIPVFHDDQHGTAIISAAGLINALKLTGRTTRDIRLVVNGAGAAAIACIELVKALGVPHDHVILCDSKGVIHVGRTEGMNQWKAAHAVETRARTLAEAMVGADVFFGLSVAGAVTVRYRVPFDAAAPPLAETALLRFINTRCARRPRSAWFCCAPRARGRGPGACR